MKEVKLGGVLTVSAATEQLFDMEEGLKIDTTKVLKSRVGKGKTTILELAAREWLREPTDKNFHKVWDHSYFGLRNYAVKMVNGDEFLADDVLSNTYERILAHRTKFDPERGMFSTWIYRICYSEAMDAMKVRSTRPTQYTLEVLCNKESRPEVFERDDYDYTDKFSGTMAGGDLSLLDREGVIQKFMDTSINIIKGFKDKGVQECMLERFCFDGSLKRTPTHEEISRKLNYPLSSVKNWVLRGKKLLRKEMLTHHRELYEMWHEVI